MGLQASIAQLSLERDQMLTTHEPIQQENRQLRTENQRIVDVYNGLLAQHQKLGLTFENLRSEVQSQEKKEVDAQRQLG